MVLSVVKAAALQFFRAVLSVIMAGLGVTAILAILPLLMFPAFLILPFPRMVAIHVVPFAIFVFLVVPMLAIAPRLFPLRTALLTDHALLFLAHFPLLVAIVGAMHFFALLKLALLPHLRVMIVPVGYEGVLRFGGERWRGKIRRIRKKALGCGGIGIAQGQAGQQCSGTKIWNVFHVFSSKELLNPV